MSIAARGGAAALNKKSEYEKTMQKSWAEDETRNSL